MNQTALKRKQMEAIRALGKEFAITCGMKDPDGQAVDDAYRAYKAWHKAVVRTPCKVTKAQFGRSLPRKDFPRYISRRDGKAGTFFRKHAFSW